MRIKRVIATLLVALFGVANLCSKDALDTPWQQWNHGQVVKMFDNSPWVQAQTYSSALAAGSNGINEVKYDCVVRLFSALPVRQSYVRMLQMMNNYEKLPPDRRQAFDTLTNGMLNRDVTNQVIVAVAISTNDPQASRDIKRFLDTSTTATLNQNAYLYSPELGRLDLAEYVPPGQHGYGAEFIFPRVKDGKAVLQPGGKELRFELWIEPINQQLRVGFKPSKLMYKGELAY
jgi:hypothetical protein